MNFFWAMPKQLHASYALELMKYQDYVSGGQLQLAWRQLERAHILGQTWAIEHTEVHWMMFRFGIRIKSWHEILGQIPRLLVGGVKSFVGKIPVGNTGGADVPPLLPMEIPDDIKELLRPHSIRK
jgi:hypothetical protein